jgi:predicted RNase H-like nuclease (RuvC/YqgF family)
MTFKTIKEQEREAYITGHTFMSDLIVQAQEAGREEAGNEQDGAYDDLQVAYNDISDLESDKDALEETITQLRAELAEADRLNAWLRTELKLAEGGQP